MRNYIIAGLLLMLPVLGYSQHSELSMQDAISLALENNYGIIIQEKNVDIAEVQNTWGAAGALPTISFSGSAGDNLTVLSDDRSANLSLSGTVSLNWTVFRGFSARISKERLDEYEKLSQGGLNVIVENTLISLINSYYQGVLSMENIEIAREVAGLSEDRYMVEQEKVNLGSSTSYNLLQAKNAYLEDQSNLLTAEANFRAVIRQINYLMGEDIDKEYILIDTFQLSREEFELSDLETRMLGNNFTLQNQYLNLKMAELDVRQAKSSYYPSLSVGASSGYNSSHTNYNVNTAMDSDINSWNTRVTASLSYTIYNGGVRKQSMRTAEMQKEIAEIETEQMEKEMRMTLRQELDFYQVRQKQVELAKENLEAAALNLKLSGERYNNGSINSFNYRDIQQLYMSVALQYQNALYNLQESYNAILRITGGLIDQY